MTDWRRSFRSELFRAWRAAGLPSPDAFERPYEELRDQGEPPAVPRAAARGPLDPVTVRSVYGFGHAIGAVCADLLCVDGLSRQASVSWCGRFNLGISLVDWLCDEAAIPPSAIAALPAFAPLTAPRRRSSPPAHDAAVFLDGLTRELLGELARDAGAPRAGEPRSALWPTLRRMLRAELALAEPGFVGASASAEALAPLRLKSVEPFRIMAERTLASGERGGQRRLCRSRGGSAARSASASGWWTTRTISGATSTRATATDSSPRPSRPTPASSPPTTRRSSTSRSFACSAASARPSASALAPSTGSRLPSAARPATP